MTVKDHYSLQILQLMSAKWSYWVNEAEYLVGNIFLLGTLIPKRRAINIDRSMHIGFHQALNRI